jgi:hypothetical protein
VPVAFERGTGCLDRNVDILFGGLMNSGDRLLGGRVNRLEGLALNALDEFVVDEPSGAVRGCEVISED